jgi:hypothetical protein
MRDRRSHPLRRIKRRFFLRGTRVPMEALSCGHAMPARCSYNQIRPAKSRRCWRCDEERQGAAA